VPEIQFVSPDGETTESSRYPGELVVVKVTGLESGATYELSNTLASPGAPSYEATLQAVADANGTIETSTAQPVGGTYGKPDPDGIFWSMKKGHAEANAELGFHFAISKSGRPLATAVLPMAGIQQGVKMIKLTGTGLVGMLYLPKRSGRVPAVITFGGSEGGEMTALTEATALVNQGYAALGLGYFGMKGLPANLEKIPLEYFEKAIRYLRARPDIGDIAVMGSSRGGELALLLGSTFSDIKAVVAQVPSPVRWAGIAGFNERDQLPPAWTYQGRPLSFYPLAGKLVEAKLADGRTAYINRPAFEKALENKKAVEAATTEIEKINGPVLLFGAEDDKIWPSCTLAEMALTRLKEKKHPFADEMACYPDAGHNMAFPPFLSTQDTFSQDQAMHMLLELGGTPEGNAAAQRASWTKTLEFLKANIR